MAKKTRKERPSSEIKGTPYFFVDTKGRWHWRITAKNGRKIAGSLEGDGFRRIEDAKTNYFASRKAMQASVHGITYKGAVISL